MYPSILQLSGYLHANDLKRKGCKENAAANTARNATGKQIEMPEVSNVALRVLYAIGHDSSVGIGPD